MSRAADGRPDAAGVMAMLRRHYLPDESRPGGIFAPEIKAPASERRADLIWQGVTAATGSALVGHEIKCSRADVLVELTDTTKSHAWQQYCNRWWLVVAHPDLVEGLEVPPTWGIYAPPSGRRTRSLTILREAPRLNPTEQAPALRTLAAWQHWQHHATATSLARAQGELERARQQVRHLEGLVPRADRNPQRSTLEQVVREVIDGLGGVMSPFGADRATMIGNWQSQVPPADIIAALHDLGVIRVRAEGIEQHAERVMTAAREMRNRVTEMESRDGKTLRAAAKRLRGERENEPGTG